MILYRYILRAHIAPFFLGLSVVILLFVLQFVMKFIDQLVGKGLSTLVIIELITTNLAWMLVLAVPMAVLAATLMAFGNLSASHEITSMKAAGVSLYRMMAPVLLASVVITVLLFFFDNDVLPEANHRAKVLATDIRRKKPTLTLVPGLFSQEISGYSILVRKTFEPSNNLEGVTIYDYTDPNANVLITANDGTLSFSRDYRYLIMDLHKGEIHELSGEDFKEYRQVRFERHRITMKAEGFEFERSSEGAFSRGDRELSVQAMMAYVDSLKKANVQSQRRVESLSAQLSATPSTVKTDSAISGAEAGQTSLGKARIIRGMIQSEKSVIAYNETHIDQYMVEVHKKYALPAACIVFVIVAAPLGMMARKGNFGVAATFSLAFFLFYWACLIGGEKLADRGLLTPFLGMWCANIFLSILGIYLTIRSARETTTFNWKKLKRFAPKGWFALDSEVGETY
jgi:lipopolysaccharide export system permease protein